MTSPPTDPIITGEDPKQDGELRWRLETPRCGLIHLVKRERVSLLVLFIVALLIRLFSYTGIIASDDLGYSHFAQQISKGTYHLFPHHYAIRYGVIVPLAVLYHFFGVQEWTTIILPVLCSSIAPPLLLLITAQLFPDCRMPWVAGILLATFPVDTHYGSIMVPEPLLQTMVFLGLILLLEAERRDSVAIGVLAGAGLGLSYLTKEPGIVVGAAFLLFLIASRRFEIAAAVVAGMSLVIGGECTWYLTQSGDLLFRAHALAAHNQSPEVLADNAHLLYRLLEGYPRIMLIPNTDFGMHSLLALICMAIALIVPRVRKESGFVLAMCWVSLPFLYLNFGSSSLTSYIALPVAARYIAILFAPLFCMAAMIVSRLSDNGGLLKHLALPLLAVVSVVGLLCGLETSGTGYRTTEVREMKRLIAEGPNRARTVCASSTLDRVRCNELTIILQPSGHKFASLERIFQIPQACVKELCRTSPPRLPVGLSTR